MGFAMPDKEDSPEKPYQGWVILNQTGNITAKQIMTDTSGRWSMTANYGSIRVYSQGGQGGI